MIDPRPWLCCVLLTTAAAAPLLAEEDEEESPWRSGLVASYNANDAQAKRIDELIAFDWQDAAPDPRLPTGPFSVSWRGRLWTQTPGVYRLYAYAAGRLEMTLNGQVLIQVHADQPKWLASPPVEMPFGRHPLEIAFHKTGKAEQLALYWSGPDFSLEPVGARFLMHDREESVPDEFERGEQLALALRCAACHTDPAAAVVPAPALDQLAGNINQAWLMEWLAEHAADQTSEQRRPRAMRRMPDFALTSEEAKAVATWLLSESSAPSNKTSRQEAGRAKAPQADAKKRKAKAKKGEDDKPKPSAAQGERLVLTRGCLACHQYGELGESGLFGGGDLTELARKRPSDFVVRWLKNPEAINRHHRMPQFAFTADELASLDLWAKARAKATAPPTAATHSRELAGRGRQVVQSLRCAACHVLPGNEATRDTSGIPALTAASDWSRSCADRPERGNNRPGYRLSADDQSALKTYYSSRAVVPGAEKSPGATKPPQARGRVLLAELNCLACHQREGVARMTSRTLQDKLAEVAELHDDLAALLPAMTPPALNSVGDKLHDQTLADAIRREGPPHRPYLLVEMPKFRLSDEQLADLIAYFTATDRVPPIDNAPVDPSPRSAEETPAEHILAAAGPRLVTTDGFGCTSCHQVGSVQPAKAPLNARGPDISMLEKRIRRTWFDRWCANPARIVPRMEMPSVQVPVRGVLGDNVQHQLAAVWHTLNTPGFEPPEPNPVRVLRLSGVPERNEKPIVIHDVVKDGDKAYLFPLVIGLPNRHNILFDLETGRLAAWWLGDTARQRTKGKTWYWEMASQSLLPPGPAESDLMLVADGKTIVPDSSQQYVARLLHFQSKSTSPDGRAAIGSITFRREVTFNLPDNRSPTTLIVTEEFAPLLANSGTTGFTRAIRIDQPADGASLQLRLVDPAIAAQWSLNSEQRSLTMPGPEGAKVTVVAPKDAALDSDGSITLVKPSVGGSIHTGIQEIILRYETILPPDQYLTDLVAVPPVDATPVEIAPGFAGRRLPLADNIMPTAFAWRPGRELVFATLKGELYEAIDTNDDDLEDASTLLADGLATPYGLWADSNFVDVSAKNGVLRVASPPQSNSQSVTVVASGWGYTDDYHDWAVGLVRGDEGEYYVALPCQQDKRSEAAANYRGQFLKLLPRKATPDNPHLFDIEVLSSGHRFPMGIARNREGELFVTDNQGNYNPFNELNHVRKGAHFGFINALEKERGYKPPPLTEPAIDIPHPWTRSVNGICFLETPEKLRGAKSSAGLPLAERADHNERGHIYGPLEGHLVGCEYDTRRLVRMSLQKIGDTYQGAVYPLSMPPKDVESGLLGPIVCAIKPTTGELYVGEIRDSGWGAGNNIGQIVKIKIEPDKLPCGIAEVRATPTGFTIDFFQPVDRAKAADPASYSIASYRRESTPAYGGPDIDRRAERIAQAEVSEDGKRVTLRLPELRAGHVYEFNIAGLAPDGGTFFPAEAHYTLRQIPE